MKGAHPRTESHGMAAGITTGIDYATLAQISGYQLGVQDCACPLCGPERRSPANQRRKVLRVWHMTGGFMTYACARCGARGYVREDGAQQPNRSALKAAKTAARRAAAATAAAKREKALSLWAQRQPIESTIAERYLREARGYGGPLPATLGFLPARTGYHPAMIAAFGMVAETEPRVFSISAAEVAAVHLTRLAPDGSAKAGTNKDKIMVGAPRGSPIVVAMPGDLGGLAVAEGIEDALSVHEATGLGTWAAGAASLMPALSEALPNWIEAITIIVDDDSAGRRNANELARQLEQRGFEVRCVIPWLELIV